MSQQQLSVQLKVSLEKPKIKLTNPGPEVIKLFSCSAQLRLKFILLINVKMLTIVGILTIISSRKLLTMVIYS